MQKRPNKPRRVIHDVEELPVLCDAAEAGLLLRLTPETVARMARHKGHFQDVSKDKSGISAGMIL